MIQPTFIRITQLASTSERLGRLPLSPNSIWRLARLGKFPKPVKLSAGVTAWRLEDIEAWEVERYKTDRDIACGKA
jgi:predicted DNA-binding transcriptional regulator AlpA